MASVLRRPIYWNERAESWLAPAVTSAETVLSFHHSLPGYGPTRLISLDKIARDIGVRAIYLKDESSRLNLPSFKILGASWGTFRAVTSKLCLPIDSSLDTVKEALAKAPTTLFAATDGNHGRAVARMATILGVGAHIYVPTGIHPATMQVIKGEGATITEVNGSYDQAVQQAFEDAETHGGVLIQDTSFPGYEDVARWVVEGYGTMMMEIDEQLEDQMPDLVIAPVGVGSFAQAVVSHYKAVRHHAKVLTVEPDTAACLYKSLKSGELCPIETTPTIMAGLDCGTVSSLAWPIHQKGVDGCLTVSDYEAHEACGLLERIGVSAGPCGAASMAALQRLTKSDKTRLGLDDSSIIVLLCTEGWREYDIPLDVSVHYPKLLAQTLANIEASVPSGISPGPAERGVARYIMAWLEHRDIESHWLECAPGRPSVIGVVRGNSAGRTLLLSGHIDTVTVGECGQYPLNVPTTDGKLYGRGTAANTKGGVAAMLTALAQAQLDCPAGDVIFSGVADNEGLVNGTEQVLAAGWRADGAIVCGPTLTDLVIAHNGLARFEVTIHGSDAISKAGYFLVELDKYSRRFLEGPKHPSLESRRVYAYMVRGGEKPTSSSTTCMITITRRTTSGENLDSVTREMEGLLKASADQVPGFSYALVNTLFRNPFNIREEHPLVSLVAEQFKKVTGREVKIRTQESWSDCSLIADKGIPVVMFGPCGDDVRGKEEEWVDLSSINTVTSTLTGIVRVFCSKK